ncbi:hypothetical protein HanIR_Chr14g0701801 [Helianthus annuus]|nr:hypothetical protein HanIR_Chr14g0701801 [Helianthus annuus]
MTLFILILLGAIHMHYQTHTITYFMLKTQTNNPIYMLNTLCLNSYMLDYSYALYLSLTSYKPPLTCIAL